MYTYTMMMMTMMMMMRMTMTMTMTIQYDTSYVMRQSNWPATKEDVSVGVKNNDHLLERFQGSRK